MLPPIRGGVFREAGSSSATAGDSNLSCSLTVEPVYDQHDPATSSDSDSSRAYDPESVGRLSPTSENTSLAHLAHSTTAAKMTPTSGRPRAWEENPLCQYCGSGQFRRPLILLPSIGAIPYQRRMGLQAVASRVHQLGPSAGGREEGRLVPRRPAVPGHPPAVPLRTASQSAPPIGRRLGALQGDGHPLLDPHLCRGQRTGPRSAE